MTVLDDVRVDVAGLSCPISTEVTNGRSLSRNSTFDQCPLLYSARRSSIPYTSLFSATLAQV